MKDLDSGGAPPGGSTEEYRAGTEEYSAHEEGASPVPRDRGSTEEYPRGTEEYSAQEEPPSPEAREGPAQEFWEREGYESLQAYMDAGWEAIGWSNRPAPRLSEVQGATPPAGKAPPPGKLPTRALKVHQVNVKLTPSEYDTLTEAARRYAVATSTLAAVLVYRGAVAALAADSDAASDAGDSG
jgi:hypothetical protein